MTRYVCLCDETCVYVPYKRTYPFSTNKKTRATTLTILNVQKCYKSQIVLLKKLQTHKHIQCSLSYAYFS